MDKLHKEHKECVAAAAAKEIKSNKEINKLLEKLNKSEIQLLNAKENILLVQNNTNNLISELEEDKRGLAQKNKSIS